MFDWIRGWFGAGAGKLAVQTVDLKDIVFSLPTLCEAVPPVKPLAGPIADAKALHEDDWRQVEFVAAADAEHIKRSLAELEFFKKAHQAEVGWKQIYLRPEHPTPFATLGLDPKGPAGLDTYPLTVGGGFVHGGFALTDVASGDWFVYGYRTAEGRLAQLAICPGNGAASKAFARWISEFAMSRELLLVDWYGVRLVDTSTADAVLEWTEGYQGE